VRREGERSRGETKKLGGEREKEEEKERTVAPWLVKYGAAGVLLV